MEWYEHLLGALAIFTCMNWILIMAIMRIRAISETRSICCHEQRAHHANSQGNPNASILKPLRKLASMSRSQRRSKVKL